MSKYCPRCFARYPDETRLCPEDETPLVSDRPGDMVGSTFDDKYLIVAELGRGGMGVVYVAEQTVIQRRVALKVLRPELGQDENVGKRFLVEARAMASLKSPHTVTLYDFGISRSGLLYYTMELLEGHSLSTLIRASAPLEPLRVHRLLSHACLALEEAHALGILHRDIKPDNLFVSGIRGEEKLTVLDFGIAKLTNDQSVSNLTQSGGFCGTPSYASPEQFLGKPATPQSDLFALGCVLYECLTGKPPYVADSILGLAMAKVHGKRAPMASIIPQLESFPELQAFVDSALSADPFRRPADAKEFAAELLRCLECDTSAIQRDSNPPPDEEPSPSPPPQPPGGEHKQEGAVRPPTPVGPDNRIDEGLAPTLTPELGPIVPPPPAPEPPAPPRPTAKWLRERSGRWPPYLIALGAAGVIAATVAITVALVRPWAPAGLPADAQEGHASAEPISAHTAVADNDRAQERPPASASMTEKNGESQRVGDANPTSPNNATVAVRGATGVVGPEGKAPANHSQVVEAAADSASLARQAAGAVDAHPSDRHDHSDVLATSDTPDAGVAQGGLAPDNSVDAEPGKGDISPAATNEQTAQENLPGAAFTALIASIPEGATVRWQGNTKSMGLTPFQLLLRNDDDGRVLVFEKEGFQISTLTISLEKQRETNRIEALLHEKRAKVGKPQRPLPEKETTPKKQENGTKKESTDTKPKVEPPEPKDKWDAL